MSSVRIGIALAVLLMCSAFPAYAYTITSQYSESQCSGTQIGTTQTVDDETGVSCADYCATQSATCCSVQHWYDFEGTYTSSRCLAKSGSGMSSNTNTATRQYWAYILSYATPQPELTAGSVTPATATEGSPVTLSATITNSGSASTNATFTNLFQRATSAAGADTTDIGTYSSAALGASASASATLSYTFPTSGTWYVRACADKNSAAGVGTITESDESNNCGSWTAISVTAVGPDLTVLDPISISGAVVSGESIQFSALAKNIGSETTGAGFESRFQLDLGANGTYDVTLDVPTAGAVSADSSDLVTSAAWEALPGSHRVRLCADLPPYDYGVIDETDEGNNCGALLDFTVSSGTTGVTDISANSVCTGTQLSTQIQDTYDTCIDFCMNATAECCTVEHHYFHNGNDLEPQWMERYTCSAHTGTSIAYQPYEEDYGPTPWVGVEGDNWYRRTTWTAYFLSYDTGLSAALVANPTAIDRGESSLLSWSSSLTASCTPTATDAQWYTTTDTQTVFFNERLASAYDCALVASGYAYWNQTTRYYAGQADPYETTCVGFQTSNGTQAMPGNSNFSYRSGTTCSAGTGTCTGGGFETGGETAGSVTVSPLITTTYTISCTDGTQTVEDTAVVTVQNILSVSCLATPNPADLFESVLWNSSVSGGTSGYSYTWSGTDGLSGSQSTAQKSYTSVGTKTATLTVVSGGEQVQTECSGEVCQEAQCTCTGPTCGVTVDEGTDTDLSADSPTLASGINEVGNAVTFSGTITNVGNNTVSGTFGNRFQVDIDADGSYDFTLDVPDSAYTIAPLGTYTVESPEWTDLPLGVHAVRFCADLPPYPDGQVVESSEGNNCSADLPFAVGDSLLVLSISAQDIVQKNGQVTVTWSATNADSCTVTGPGLSAVSPSGSELVTIASESTYTITCTRGALTSSESTTVRIAPRFEEV